MLREYAIQPEVLTNLEHVRYFLDTTGVHHGRMIAEYPKRWRAMVYAACGTCRPVEKSRIEERLRDELRIRLVPSARSYDASAPSWTVNALREHAADPFCGVVLQDDDPSPRSATVLSATSVDNTCECWRVSRDEVIPRSASAICCAASMLLKESREVVLVDQYFAGGGTHGRPFVALLDRACQGAQLHRLEYHLAVRYSWTHFVDVLRAMLPYLPTGQTLPLRFIRWSALPDGDGMHPRYVLTERGGLKFDWGLGEEISHTTDVSLLDSGIYSRRWGEYCASSTAFQFVDGLEILNGALNRLAVQTGQFVNVGPV